MDWQKLTDALLEILIQQPPVEGVFLSGSLVNHNRDEFSDMDLGIVSGNGPDAFEQAWGLRFGLMQAWGQPIQYLERGWGNCRMVAALYGKSQFPPMGLELDLVFSRLQDVGEQMPYSQYRVLWDRRGLLGAALGQLPKTPAPEETLTELRQHLSWCLFYVHDAKKALGRQDRFHFQSLLEQIRKLIFFAAAQAQGIQMLGAKRAYGYLSEDVRHTLEATYAQFDLASLQALLEEYLVLLGRLDYQSLDLEGFRAALGEIL
jgi:hypothetical protein